MNKDEAPASPKDAALRLALEALEIYVKGYADRHKSLYPTIATIKQALEETPRVSPEPEPVATVYEGAIAKWNLPEKFTGFLYTSPPASKPWVGLTQQDIDIAFDDTQEGGGFNEFARAIEAKLKEKNHERRSIETSVGGVGTF